MRSEDRSAAIAQLIDASEKRVVLVGGANTDVIGLAGGKLVPRDSNPGHVRLSSGGVARNIAENLARLGAATHLITAFGADHNARELAEECRSAGIDVQASVVAGELPGSVYLAIHDEGGDMAVAINDMRALERLTVEELSTSERRTLLDSADLVIADANVPAEALDWLVRSVCSPVLVDPVSVAKAPRVAPLLPFLAAVTPNASEAGVLLGREVRNRDQAQTAARDLVAAGVGVAFVTCGSFGVAFADAETSGLVSAPVVDHVSSATGAGDAFAAGAAWGMLAGVGVREAAAFGSALAAFALQSERTVSDEIALESVARAIACDGEEPSQ